MADNFINPSGNDCIQKGFILNHITLSDTVTFDAYADLSTSKVGEQIEIAGIIHNFRQTKWGGFLLVRTVYGLIQTVVSNDTTKVLSIDGSELKPDALVREASIQLTGTVNASKIKDRLIYCRDKEITVARIQVLSVPDIENPVDLKSLENEKHIYDYRMSKRHLTLRNIRDIAIFKVSSVIVATFADFLRQNNFTQIYSPKIVSAGAEGGANIFELKYFDRPAYLAQSPQLYKQMCIAVFQRVFEIAPAFRAEKSHTSRHLTEYISLDVEFGFIKDHTDIMLLEAKLLRYILKKLEELCPQELAILEASLPKMPEQLPVFTLRETHEILHSEFADRLLEDHRNEPDLAPEEEVLICEYVLKKFDSDFVFVTHFPTDHRAFYSMDDPQNPELTLSYDLLLRGIEITSGSQRIHQYNEYLRKMQDRNMSRETFEYYLEAFQNGMPPHGGFAIGLERITSCILGLDNVKEASLFPRDVARLTP